MALIRTNQISVAFGARSVLQDVSISIDENARIALVGRNGEGKSTLLKVLSGDIAPDQGQVTIRNGIRVAYLPQTVPTDLQGTVYQIVASGLEDVGQLLSDYSVELEKVANGDGRIDRLAQLQDKIDAVDGWTLEQRVRQTLTRMQLDADDEVASFSGGRKRRVLLARALVSEPELLLLDEPTNHLDIGAVDWLETQLGSFPGSIMLITHDRAFLDSVATLIMELDRGHLTEWPGNFSAYQKGKLAQLEVEAEQNSLFDKKLAQEEAWIRQGIKARRTRNEGRVRALEKLREQHRDRRSRSATANMSVNQAARSGKMVFEATDVSFQFDDQTVINNLDLVMLRNDRLGIIGPNGCGKSTLVRLLVGELEPTAGEIRRGTQLEVAYFDQLRTQLDPDRSAADNVSGGKDEVIINGASRHIMSYMQDFLFIPARARAPITALSGGETARLMLAKLFLQPSNLLVLDEPSNDLDIETLELLESLIAEYAGSVIMISHDRRLLDNIVTRSLVHQGAGRFIDVIGGYTDFERERLTSDHLKPVFPVDTRQNPSRTSTSELAVPQPTPTQPKINAGSGKASGSKAKLSQKFQRELDMQPALIDELEAQLEKLHTTMAEPDFYTNTATSSKVVEESEAKQLLLDAAYTRWEELEKMRNA